MSEQKPPAGKKEKPDILKFMGQCGTRPDKEKKDPERK